MITVAEAAKRAGRDPETIRRWIRAGKLAAWKVGGQHMIDDAMLDKVLRPTRSADPVPAHQAVLAPGAGRHRAGESAVAYGPTRSATESGGRASDMWLPHIVGRIVRIFDPVRIVLFGDRLRDDPRPDTEYGLVVVLEKVADRWQAGGDVRMSFADLPVFAQVLVAPLDEVEGREEGPSIDHAYGPLRDGITIYDRDISAR